MHEGACAGGWGGCVCTVRVGGYCACTMGVCVHSGGLMCTVGRVRARCVCRCTVLYTGTTCVTLAPLANSYPATDSDPVNNGSLLPQMPSVPCCTARAGMAPPLLGAR